MVGVQDLDKYLIGSLELELPTGCGGKIYNPGHADH